MRTQESTKQIDKSLDELDRKDIELQHSVSMLRLHVSTNLINGIPTRASLAAAMSIGTSKTLQVIDMR